jgi:hypothetical protein
MKLWQAILAGCRRRKQTKDTLFSKALDGAVYSCALGAAYEGIAGEVCWDNNRTNDCLHKISRFEQSSAVSGERVSVGAYDVLYSGQHNYPSQ